MVWVGAVLCGGVLGGGGGRGVGKIGKWYRLVQRWQFLKKDCRVTMEMRMTQDKKLET